MAWRGTITPLDRVFGCLPYLLPLVEGLIFGSFLFRQFPAIGVVFLPFLVLQQIYASIPFAGMIVFFVLFLAVVRNPQINHFIRFNTMQAILIDIALFLCRMAMQILLPALGGLIGQTLFNTIFLGLLAVVIYSVAQTVLGRYAEIPGISEAVYTQVP